PIGLRRGLRKAILLSAVVMTARPPCSTGVPLRHCRTSGSKGKEVTTYCGKAFHSSDRQACACDGDRRHRRSAQREGLRLLRRRALTHATHPLRQATPDTA